MLRSQRSNRKSVLLKLVFIVTIVALLTGACQPATPAPTQPPAASSGDVKRGGELTIGRHEEPLSFDPAVPGDNGSIYLLVQVMETLTRPDATGAGIEPDLAESWDVSDDKLVYTFHLRDAKFSNGDPVTASDVEFSIGRAKDKSGYAFLYEPIDKIEAVDAKTVRFTLKRPYVPFLSSMALFTGSIVPKKVYEANPDGFSSKPVGSGPFMVQEYTRGDKVVLVPNPNYWEKAKDGKPYPYLDKITVKYVPETTSRVLGLRNNDFDVITGVPYNEAESIKADSGLALEVAPIYRLDYVYVNHAAPPLDKKEFRLALNYAANREAILKNVFFGIGEIPNSFMPKMNFWSKDVPLIPYDLAKAKELVTQSGYNGEEIDILIASGNSVSKQIATILQQSWGEAGIKSKISELDGGAIWDQVTSGKYMVNVSYITSDINDDDELATLQGDYKAPGEFHSFMSWYQSDTVSDLLKKARETTDSAERAKYYKQVQETAYNDGYSIPLNFTPAVNAYHARVQGWKNITTGWWWLKQVWLNK